MSFKPMPLKDPDNLNTPDDVIVLRKIDPSERIQCEVELAEAKIDE